MPRIIENSVPPFWTLLLVVLTSSTVQAQVKDCTDSLRNCEETYKTNLLGPLSSNNKTKICSVFSVLTKCMDDLDCPIAPEAKRNKVEYYRKGLLEYNYTCVKEVTRPRKLEVSSSLKSRPVNLEFRENQECQSIIQSCKNEYMQRLHPHSGKNEAIANTTACNIDITYIECVQDCKTELASACELFQNRNKLCDFILCPERNVQASNYASRSPIIQLQHVFLSISIVRTGVMFWS